MRRGCREEQHAAGDVVALDRPALLLAGRLEPLAGASVGGASQQQARDALASLDPNHVWTAATDVKVCGSSLKPGGSDAFFPRLLRSGACFASSFLSGMRACCVRLGALRGCQCITQKTDNSVVAPSRVACTCSCWWRAARTGLWRAPSPQPAGCWLPPPPCAGALASSPCDVGAICCRPLQQVFVACNRKSARSL